MVAWRSYLRHRDNLIRYRSAHIQQMQKALQLMNLQLTHVISDITGQTGLCRSSGRWSRVNTTRSNSPSIVTPALTE